MAISDKLRDELTERAKGLCEYCRCPLRYSTTTYDVEHITPISRGGTDDPDNLASACHGCNNRKREFIDAIDPISGQKAPLFHPRRDKWEEHFVWDGLLVVGITDVGRVTVERLKLNRAGCVGLRRVMGEIGEHPPPL